MICNKHSVDLTPQEIAVIEAALHTQEKILSMQSRAGGDGAATVRLTELKSTLRNLRRQNRTAPRGTGLTGMARTLFG